MKDVKFKLIVSMVVLVIAILAISISVYATNENIEILKKSDTDYLIYIKNNQSSDFEFAFSNDVNANKDSLAYTKAATDTAKVGANKIAYVDNSVLSTKIFDSTVYMWAREVGTTNYILEKAVINLNEATPTADIEKAVQITKNINVNAEETTTIIEFIDSKEVTVTVGKIVLLDEGNYEYQIVKLPNTEDYNNFMILAEKVSKITSDTDMVTKISIYEAFLKAYNKLVPDVSSKDWIKVQENEIEQPKDAEDGDQYIVWIKSGDKIDVQFMTSTKQYSEEEITEKITTKLPVTYESNVLLIVLGVLVVAIVVMYIMVRRLENKQEK